MNTYISTKMSSSSECYNTTGNSYSDYSTITSNYSIYDSGSIYGDQSFNNGNTSFNYYTVSESSIGASPLGGQY